MDNIHGHLVRLVACTHRLAHNSTDAAMVFWQQCRRLHGLPMALVGSRQDGGRRAAKACEIPPLKYIMNMLKIFILLMLHRFPSVRGYLVVPFARKPFAPTHNA